MNLRTLSYDEAEAIVASKSDEELVSALAGESRKLADTAFEHLSRRNRLDLVLHALREKSITTRDGKVRALNLLLSRGRSLPEALPIYREYATDRSKDVASCALFGLVFWSDVGALPLLESVASAKHSALVRKAIEALKSDDPKKYSPGFHDASGVWKKG